MAAAAVIYAKDVARMSAFYAALTGAPAVRTEDGFAVLGVEPNELFIVAIPPHIAAGIQISRPPERREDTPIKLIFATASLTAMRRVVAGQGGAMNEPAAEWEFRGWRVCDGHDPEGNVFQLRRAIGA